MSGLFKRVASFRTRVNEEMRDKCSPSMMALALSAAAAVLIVIMLFVPNYLGVGGDGSVNRVMESVDLAYVSDDVEQDANEYFNRVYAHADYIDYSAGADMSNSQIFLLKTAIFLDDLVTGDNFFDIRCLALLYAILFIPALYLLIKQACIRVQQFSERIVVCVLGVLIFADVAYVTYFNSLYPEALWFISFLYCIAAAMSFQQERSFGRDLGALLLLSVAGIVLMTSRAQCAFVGVILTLYCVKLLFIRREWKWGVICVMTGLCLSLCSLGSMLWLEADFDETDQFHAMTRGVMFEADDPAEVLGEFGIDPSFELLADASLYDHLPVVTVSEEVIQEDFLSQYTALDIGRYYLHHPGKFLRMLDIAIKSCFGVRRGYCGNYERSVGLPGGAKSLFWSAYSTFKDRSAPKTVGYLVILVGIACLLFGRGYSLRPKKQTRDTVVLDCFIVMVLLILYQAGVTIVNSGDAAMTHHCFLVSAALDVMTYFVLVQIVHKTKIF